MRHYDSMSMEEQNSPSFHKEDEPKRPSASDFVGEAEDELELQDVFNASHSSFASSNHSSTEANLIHQFNESVGSIDRSVAEFYLEMCDNDLHAAVNFFKDQTSVAQHQKLPAVKPYAQAISPPVVTRGSRRSSVSRRGRSFDDAPALHNRYSTTSTMQTRVKSFDVAEAPRVTAPSIHRSNHARYPAIKLRPQPVRRSAEARFSHRRASQFVSPPPRNEVHVARLLHRRATQCVQLPNRKVTPWGRSKSEQYFRDPSLKPQPSRSNTHSRSYSQNEAATATVSRPRDRRNSGYQRAQSWEPPSSHYNPAA